MRQKLFIFFALIMLFAILIGLNAATYVQREKIPDSEQFPNRSTYNVGATGTRAFYDLLAVTNGNVMRWQKEFPEDTWQTPTEFSTFVIIGKTLKVVEEDEISRILDWVSDGGKLVIIDRNPPRELVSTTANWDISINTHEGFLYTVDPSNQTQMVGKTSAVKPVQPTIFTRSIAAVQTSKFTSSINIKRESIEEDVTPPNVPTSEAQDSDYWQTPPPISPPPQKSDEDDGSGSGFGTGNGSGVFEGNSQAGDIVRTNVSVEVAEEVIYPQAPVVHLANEEINVLADFPFGDGQIVFLTDPYIVSNSGIKLVDNGLIATNIVTSDGGIIAFDEYHNGYAKSESRLIKYFTGTPIVPIFIQLLLIIALIFYSQSRRFARALPVDESNRLSKLEYVSAMAQLQRRTKAFDLAIENIYTDFRRRVSRLFAVDSQSSTRKELAEKIAERLNRNAHDIEEIMFKCEDIMHGEKTNKKEVIALTGQIRELEEALGLRRGKKSGRK